MQIHYQLITSKKGKLLYAEYFYQFTSLAPIDQQLNDFEPFLSYWLASITNMIALWLQSRRHLSHKGVIFGFEASQYETKNPKIFEWLINSSKRVGKTGKLMRTVCYRGVFFLQGSKLVVNLHNPCLTLRCKHFCKICLNSHEVVHLTTKLVFFQNVRR